MNRKSSSSKKVGSLRSRYGSSSSVSKYGQDPVGDEQENKKLTRQTSYSSETGPRRKNSVKEKFPKITNIVGMIHASKSVGQTSSHSHTHTHHQSHQSLCFTINEYEDCADIPFSQIFVDEGDEVHNESIKGSQTSINNGSALDLRRGLPHSSTLPPMSEHQRRSQSGKHKSARKKESHSSTIGRNNSRLGAVMEDDRPSNGVFQVLAQANRLRDNPEDDLDDTPPNKSGFYFGDLDETDENTIHEERMAEMHQTMHHGPDNFESMLQAARGNRYPSTSGGTSGLGGFRMSARKLTLTKIYDKFLKLKHQPSVESSNSESEVNQDGTKSKSKKSNGDFTRLTKLESLYVALYNFDAQEQDDLSLRAGDFVRVVNTNNESWWLGERGKRSGYFPSNYVMKREPHDKALICKKSVQVLARDNTEWTLKRSQIVLVDGAHYKTEKSDHIFIRSSTFEACVPRCHLSLIDQ